MINNINVINEIYSFEYSGKLSILNCIRQALLSKNLHKIHKMHITSVDTNLIYLIKEIQRTFNQIYINEKKNKANTFKLKFKNKSKKNILVKSESIDFFNKNKKKVDLIVRNDLVLFILLPEQYINIKGTIIVSDSSYVSGYFKTNISTNITNFDNLKNIKCEFNTYEIYSHKEILIQTIDILIDMFSTFNKKIIKKSNEYVINIKGDIDEILIILLVDTLNEYDGVNAGYKAEHILLDNYEIKILSDLNVDKILKECIQNIILIFKKLIKQIKNDPMNDVIDKY